VPVPRPKKKYQNPVLVFPQQPQPVQQQNTIAPRYLNIPQAAQYCSVTTWCIRRLISTGQIKAAKIGRRLTVDRLHLDELWQKRAA
jgi:excisionase family DNA binding protein